MESLAISSLKCVRIILKELVGKINMKLYAKIFISFMNFINLTFPTLFIPYSETLIDDSCKIFCSQMLNDSIENIIDFKKLQNSNALFPNSYFDFDSNSNDNSNTKVNFNLKSNFLRLKTLIK